MVISSLASGVMRGADRIGTALSETLFEPTIRLGVTGLARAGKTVFTTSLVANLLERGRMSGLTAAREGRIDAAFLQPQPDDTVPRFDYEEHIEALSGAAPHWPESTRAVSELRLSLRVAKAGLLAGLQTPRRIHLDIVDYPGEWLLDLALMDKDYAAWSAAVLARFERRGLARDYIAAARAAEATAALDETRAQALARAFTAALEAARAAGWSDLTPGRFLLPGDLAGSPALTFAPLPPQDGAARGSLYREFERRFGAYKSKVVEPFFRAHFARIDRQVVLIDLLGAIHRGPEAVADLRDTMAEILSAFRPGRSAFLARLFGARRVDRILFAATKADHLHHVQHPKMTVLVEALMAEARERARFAGAQTAAMAIAALRATTEEMRAHEGVDLPCVRGWLAAAGEVPRRQAAFYPGDLPDSLPQMLAGGGWLDEGFEAMAFAPAPMTLRPGQGPPHIRLDRAAEFLLGDRL